MTRVASFDVFDTLLTRVVGSPSTVFLLLGKRLRDQSLIPCTAEVFARCRMEAESRARANAPHGEVTLVRIYEELGAALCLTEGQRDELMRRECELEAELIRVVPGARAEIVGTSTRVERVVFVSDMYLPSAFIQEQLARHDLLPDQNHGLYVSCEQGCSKSEGMLHRHVAAREAVEPVQVLHCGNDPVADDEMARRAGARVKLFRQGNLNRYERILEAHTWASEGLSSVMAGASRLARLDVPVASPREEAIRDVGAAVAAPVLVGYVLWLLRRAQQSDLRRLYFVSRDGQILLQIARRLAKRLNISCELRYLHGSRQAWHLPSISSIAERQLDWILDETAQMSVQSVLGRLCVRAEEIRERLYALGLRDEDWQRDLDPRERQLLCRMVEDPQLQQLAIQRAAAARQALIEYLRQEGVLDGTNWAFVDLGWRGRMQESLAAVLAAAGAPAPTGLYFGLTSAPPDGQAGRLEAYFFDRRSNTGYDRVIPSVGPLMEMFCAGTHGMVAGYEAQETGVAPVFKSELNQPALDWGLALLQETICRFVDELALGDGLVNPYADTRKAAAELLQAFWLDPSKAEALAWAGFPVEDDQAGAFVNRLGQACSWRHAVRAFRTGSLHLDGNCLWEAGSLAMTRPPLRDAVLLASKAGRAARRVKRWWKTAPGTGVERQQVPAEPRLAVDERPG